MDHQRDQLFRKLIGPVIVRAIGDQHRQREGVAPGPHQMIGRGLGRRVGAVRLIAARLGEGRFVGRERTKHLVGRHVQEAERRLVRRAEAVAIGAACFQQAERAHHVGADEIRGAVDRAVDMRLGGEVDHRRRPVFPQQAHDQLGVADVAVHERVARVVGRAGEIVEIAGVSELVEADHRRARAAEPFEHEIRADKAGRAGHQDRPAVAAARIVDRSGRGHVKSVSEWLPRSARCCRAGSDGRRRIA